MPRTPTNKPPIRWRPRPLPIAAVAAAAFVGLTGFLGLRVASGEDPALGSRTSAAQVRQADTATSGDATTYDDQTQSGDAAPAPSTPNPSTGTSGG